MSTETNAAPAAANVAVDPIKPVPTQQVSEDPNREPSELPPWVTKRLEQAKRSGAKDAEIAARKALLEEMGFADLDVAKKLATEEKKRAEAQKSLEQRVAERDEALKSKDSRNKELEDSVKVFADERLSTLSESQRKAVVDLAGDDPAKQLKTIAALQPTWTAVVPPTIAPIVAVPPATTPIPVAPPKPANATAPAPNAPAPAGTTEVQNHYETHEWLKVNRPFAASTYYQVHYSEINEAAKKRSN